MIEYHMIDRSDDFGGTSARAYLTKSFPLFEQYSRAQARAQAHTHTRGRAGTPSIPRIPPRTSRGQNWSISRAAPFPLSLFPLVFFRLPIFVSRVKSFEPCNPVRF
jgi:hypothetical protein